MNRLLIVNLFISLLWPTLNGDYSLGSVFTGFVLGFIVLTIVQRSYGKYYFYAAEMLGYVLYAILQSNLKLAGLVLRALVSRELALRPAIIAVPLNITNPFERTLLASVITLTPGTLSVDLGEQDGQDVLYVHTINLTDPNEMRREITESFERRILRLHDLQADLLAEEKSDPVADSAGEESQA